MAKAKVDMFEEASRKKLTFKTENGLLSVSDLWDLPLDRKGNRVSLDAIALTLHALRKAEGEVLSFVDEDAQGDPLTELQFGIVMRVIAVKKEEIAARAHDAEKAQIRQQILAVLARKKEGALETMTEAQLLKKLEAL